jgi:hypothetical protein
MSPKNIRNNKNKVKDSITVHLPEDKIMQLQGIASGFGVTPEIIAQQWIIKQLARVDEPGKITHAMTEQLMMQREEEKDY